MEEDNRAKSYPSVSCRTMSHHITSCDILLHRVTYCNILSHHVTYCHIMSHIVTSCHTLSLQVTICQNIKTITDGGRQQSQAASRFLPVGPRAASEESGESDVINVINVVMGIFLINIINVINVINTILASLSMSSWPGLFINLIVAGLNQASATDTGQLSSMRHFGQSWSVLVIGNNSGGYGAYFHSVVKGLTIYERWPSITRVWEYLEKSDSPNSWGGEHLGIE